MVRIQRAGRFNDSWRWAISTLDPLETVDSMRSREMRHLAQNRSDLRGAHQYRAIHMVGVSAQFDGWPHRRFTRDENRDHRRSMRGLVKVFKVECVVPNLVDVGSVKLAYAHLKLNYHDHPEQDENDIRTSAHPRNAVFEKHPALREAKCRS